jgi:hypothetical protein
MRPSIFDFPETDVPIHTRACSVLFCSVCFPVFGFAAQVHRRTRDRQRARAAFVGADQGPRTLSQWRTWEHVQRRS